MKKEAGMCPFSAKYCKHIRSCLLGKKEACAMLISNRYGTCVVCKKRNQGKCIWECFRFFKGLT
jgi:hypothetical protein